MASYKPSDPLEHTLQRPIACIITDSEGGGLPLGRRYAQAERHYVSILPQEQAYSLADFEQEGRWEPVKGDPDREAARARWADPKRAAEDPRGLVLMRPCGQSEPTRIYTGRFTEELTAGEVPWLHRRRWSCNELRIRDLIQGANLNANYGYTYQEVPHRTRQRAWVEAQARVEITDRQLSNHQIAVHNLRRRLAHFQDTYTERRRVLRHHLAQRQLDLRHQQRLEETTTRARQWVGWLREELVAQAQWFQRRQRRLLGKLHYHKTKACQLQERLIQRIAVRDAIDTETLCRERELEKDQIMLNLQILLGNLHDWAAQSYFVPEWRTLSLEKATQMIYRKAGRVRWYADRLEVELEPYRYEDQQRAMEATCTRFNAANLRWCDGRLLRISVAPPG